MLKTTLAFITVLLATHCTELWSQNKVQLSLSGTYGLIANKKQPDVSFNALGTSLGMELQLKKKFSLGVDVDWQRLESEPAIAEPFPQSGLPVALYTIERHQFNIRPTFRYYFKEAYQGFYVGAFFTYSYLTITTSDFPTVEPNHYFALSDPSDDFGSGAGLTYGFRLKLTPALRASAFGSHQLFLDALDKEKKQQDHQFGLGLNWVFGK
jgi:hypothetical protein